eukprot:m.218683 g.218683  ORF g.218683 m.218683 type:complete len:414 (+) comp15905_c1_seq4:1706-2947(+)
MDNNQKFHLPNCTADLVASVSFWKEFCPELTIGGDGGSEEQKSGAKLPETLVKNYAGRIEKDGYFTVSRPPADTILAQQGPGIDESMTLNIWEGINLTTLALCANRLKEHGWPPTFLLVYDEVWEMQRRIAKLVTQTTGNTPNMDMLIFHIDPNSGDAGFSPHRDRQPNDPPSSFRSDGTPKYSTCWIALTEATPENSCLYFIPRQADPGYYKGDGHGENDDMLRDALHGKEQYQYIRAIPLKAGECAIFSHRIIHWGSRGRPGYPVPRIAISFAFSSDDFEAHYIPDDLLPLPPLATRLALAGGQMINYHERFPHTKHSLRLCHNLFQSEMATSFCKEYNQKIAREFLAAAEELEAQSKAQASSEIEGQDEDEDDVLDSALDAMLEADSDGNFNDDYEGSDVDNDDAFEDVD